MKKLGLIILAVIVVAIAAFGILILTLPRAKVTIRAIGPTGRFATRTNSSGQVVSGPEWLFGITNAGRANGGWTLGVYSRQSIHSGILTSETAGLAGVLQPGEGFVTNMIVAIGDNPEWSGWARCHTLPTPFQQFLWNVGYATPVIGRRRELLPREVYRWDRTSWHKATNATPASSTATNTP